MNEASVALLGQIKTLFAARDVLNDAINEITDSINPDTANWKDVSKFTHLIDAIRRAEIAT